MLLIVSLFSINTQAQHSPLIGDWENSKIQLSLKHNQKYTFSVKILGIRKEFKGTWSTKRVTKKSGKKANLLILRYYLFGKKKKISEYSFDRGRLKLIQDGRVQYLKKKV